MIYKEFIDKIEQSYFEMIKCHLYFVITFENVAFSSTVFSLIVNINVRQ